MCPDRNWTSSNSALTLPRGSCEAFGSLTSPALAFPACCGPPCLSVVGEPDDPGSLPESLPFEIGIRCQVARHTGFRQSSFRPITRVLQDGTFSVFQWLPLLRHALFPSGFRLQVNRMTQEQSSGLLLTESGIQHRVPRRTLSAHPALRRPDSRGVRSRACRPPRSQAQVHLTPFAVYPAFPDSDYYEVSVAMGPTPAGSLTL